MNEEKQSFRFNLEKVRVLIFDGDAMSTDIMAQILSGFGAKNISKATSVEDAKRFLGQGRYDLVVIDPAMAGPNGYDFLPWLRRTPGDNRFAHVLVVTGHTQHARIAAARDSGANLVVAKPLTPVVILDRIAWMAREKRPYVECKVYAGPDRRFKFDGPPVGSEGRRDADLPPEVGDATEPNMSQGDIDAMMAPRKVTL
jgi:CheY-like chemotaxis protein